MPAAANAPNDREDPRDCNPMFKRLPAEVITRRGGAQANKKESKPQAVEKSVELEQVLQKRPDGRAKWLAKALAQAADGRLDAQSLYLVVAHNRFIEELTDKAGKRMYRVLHANLHVFSSKQRKFLEKESALAKAYAATAFAGSQKDDEDADREEKAASAMEEMMARCRAFVRDKQSERGERQGSDASAEAVAATQALFAAAAAAPEEPDGTAAEAVPEGAEAPPAVTDAAEAPPGNASRSRSRSKAEKKKKEKGRAKSRSKSGKRKRKSSSSSRSRRRRDKSSSRSRSRSKRTSKSRGRSEKAKKGSRKRSSSSSAKKKSNQKSKRKRASSSRSSSDRKNKKKRR